MRRSYPQIYDSDVKLLVDPSTVQVTEVDFTAALSRITPASHRAAAADARWVWRGGGVDEWLSGVMGGEWAVAV